MPFNDGPPVKVVVNSSAGATDNKTKCLIDQAASQDGTNKYNIRIFDYCDLAYHSLIIQPGVSIFFYGGAYLHNTEFIFSDNKTDIDGKIYCYGHVYEGEYRLEGNGEVEIRCSGSTSYMDPVPFKTAPALEPYAWPSEFDRSECDSSDMDSNPAKKKARVLEFEYELDDGLSRSLFDNLPSDSTDLLGEFVVPEAPKL